MLMSEMWRPAQVVRVAGLSLSAEPVEADQVVRGAPEVGTVAGAVIGGAEVGVWQLSPGTVTDVEVDEVFVVVSGRATVRFVDPELPAIEVGPGDLVRLEAGMRTEWTVHETLRKVYVLAAD